MPLELLDLSVASLPCRAFGPRVLQDYPRLVLCDDCIDGLPIHSRAAKDTIKLKRLATGERPITSVLTSIRYWLIPSVTIPALFIAGWIFVATGIAAQVFVTSLPYTSVVTSGIKTKVTVDVPCLSARLKLARKVRHLILGIYIGGRSVWPWSNVLDHPSRDSTSWSM